MSTRIEDARSRILAGAESGDMGAELLTADALSFRNAIREALRRRRQDRTNYLDRQWGRASVDPGARTPQPPTESGPIGGSGAAEPGGPGYTENPSYTQPGGPGPGGDPNPNAPVIGNPGSPSHGVNFGAGGILQGPGSPGSGPSTPGREWGGYERGWGEAFWNALRERLDPRRLLEFDPSELESYLPVLGMLYPSAGSAVAVGRAIADAFNNSGEWVPENIMSPDSPFFVPPTGDVANLPEGMADFVPEYLRDEYYEGGTPTPGSSGGGGVLGHGRIGSGANLGHYGTSVRGGGGFGWRPIYDRNPNRGRRGS